MSDFLTDLLARSLEPPAIRPRLPSVYEPVGSGGPRAEERGPKAILDVPAGPPAIGPAGPVLPPASRPVTPNEAAVSPRSVSPLHRTPPSEPSETSEPPHRTPAVRREDRTEPLGATGAEEGAPPRRRGGRARERQDRRERTNTEVEPLRPASSRERDREPDPTSSTPRRIDPRDDRGSGLPPVPLAASREVEQPRPASGRDPRRGPAEVRVQPVPGPREVVVRRSAVVPVHLPALPAPGRADTVDAPIVHVSIGRIEVRAVPAKDVVRPRSPAVSPTMTLEEYLHRRAGASR